MPRTITIDNLEVVQVRLVRDPDGKDFRLYAEYRLTAGGQHIRAEYRDVTRELSASLQAQGLALFDAVVQALTASELS